MTDYRRACLPYLALGGIVFAAYVALLWRRAGPVGSILVGTLCTFSVLAILGGAMTILRSWPDARALGRARAGRSPRDGRLEAFTGSLEAEGEPLESPFTATPCVAYEYDVEPAAGGGSDHFGIAMTPATVRGRRGDARLLGFPDLAALGRPEASEPEARARAERFLGGAASERLTSSPLGVVDLIGGLLEASAEVDGALRCDWRRVDEVALRGDDRLFEQYVEVGGKVTALGIYDAARSGLVAGRGVGASLVRILPGGLEAAHRALVRNTRRAMLFPIAWGLLLQGFFVLVWFLSGGE